MLTMSRREVLHAGLAVGCTLAVGPLVFLIYALGLFVAARRVLPVPYHYRAAGAIAAAAVILGHSYKVNGGGENDFLVQMGWGVGIYTGSVAVEVFFVLSGFLVANSWIRRPHLFALNTR